MAAGGASKKVAARVEELRATLNPSGVPDFEGCALDGTGVFETLQAVSKLVIASLG